MQQMNHVLQQRAADGYEVAACGCGAHHRDVPIPKPQVEADGGALPNGQEAGSPPASEHHAVQQQHNLYYHILLRKPLHS